MNKQLSATVFVNYINKSSDIDEKSKQIIKSKLIECETLISKNKNIKAFNNWSNLINKEVSKYAIYYYNYEPLVPCLLNKIWDKLTDERKDRWYNSNYTDNYPYILLLFDYSINECDLIYKSYKCYMEEREFYLEFNLLISKIIILLSLDNKYLLSYIVENILIHIQRRIIKICKTFKEIRKKIIEIFMTYKEEVSEDTNLYFINILKKLVYYDRHGGLISLNVSFNNRNQIKIIE
jgi:hypothetical protein